MICGTDSCMNPCDSNPCQNDGVCIDNKDTYTCDCSDTGFIDTLCTFPEIELLALRAFYDASSNRNDWATNWDFDDNNPCYWIGITCNDEQSSITQIILESKGIIGSLPSELGNLSNLEILNVQYNHLSGPIPSEVAYIERLWVCELGSNYFDDCDELHGLLIAMCGTDDSCMNPCDSNPCQNDGVCIDNKDTYTCDCSDTDFIDTLCTFPEIELLALRAFYDASSNRNDWATNWDFDDNNPCSWIGITCNDEQSSITQIKLDSKGIIGKIPSELGNLSNLEILNVQNNQLKSLYQLN